MKSKAWIFALLVMWTGAAGVAFWRLREANARLRPQIAAARDQRAEKLRARDEDRRLQALVALAQRDDADAMRAIQLEAAQARNEVADLEKRAEERRAAKLAKEAAAAEALAKNRDLTKGLVLLENCADVGRATPAEAFQTMIWATVKGEDDVVARMSKITGASRLLAEGVIAGRTGQKEYATPEKLVALLFADALLDVSAIRVADQRVEDATHVTLTVERVSGRSAELPMELGPEGWSFVASEALLSKQIKTVLGPRPTPAKK